MADEWDSSATTSAGKAYDSGSKYATKQDDEWGAGAGAAASAAAIAHINSRKANTTDNKADDDAWGSNNNDDTWGDTKDDSRANGFKSGQQNRENNWDCACGASNFPNRYSCFKCKEAKPGGNGEDDKRKDNWDCSCGASNFPNRYSCFKCKEAKPGNDNGEDARKDNWDCSCGANNFPSRYSCFKCKEAKPGGGDGGDRRSQKRPGDWECKCGQSNFASRTSCYKCSEEKPEGAGGDDRQSQKRSGDWDCQCGQSNFASRSSCFKCSEEKPEGAGGDDRQSQKRPGDWDCQCGTSNFASRSSCYKCNEEKPEGAGGGEAADGPPKENYVPVDRDENEIFDGGITSGINFDNFERIPVNLSGEDPKPKPCTSFADAGLEQFLVDNINRCKYTKPTPIQKYGIPIIMQKRDLMGCAQTGSGKTAAYLVPIINVLLTEGNDMSIGKPHVVIMAPTRELAIQIYDEARKFAAGSILKVCLLYGGTNSRHQSGIFARGCHILVATPGRLKDFVDKSIITFEDIKFMVLDEADRMLDMGFMQTVDDVMNHSTMVSREQRQTLMFSATFAEEVQTLAAKFLKNYLFLTVGIVGGASADVEQKVYQLSKFDKRPKLLEILKDSDPTGTIVFVETKRTADTLASIVSETKIPTTSIHGDRMQSQREQALRDFKTGKMKILIATSVAARGLDIPNVLHVINYDLPKGIDDYVHRIGRTGRVGNRGKATSFFEQEQDGELAGNLMRILQQANQEVPDFLKDSGGGGFTSSSFGGRDVRNGDGAEAAADDDWA